MSTQGVRLRLQILGTAIAAGALLAVAAPGAEVQYPLAVAVDGEGTIYLADRNLPGIWKLNGGEPSLLFQGSKQFRTPLNAVRCVVIDGDGRLLAGDSATRDVYRFDEDGKPAPLTGGRIGIPMSIAVNAAGELLVADLELHRIFKVPAEGGEPAVFAEVRAPRGLAIDAEDRLWVVSHGEDQLLRFSPSGEKEVVVSGRPFEFPSAVVVGPEDIAYVCDTYAKAVWKVAGGKPEKWIAGAPLVSPVGLARRGESLLIADPHAVAVFEADAGGELKVLFKAGRGE
jgi:sugar lactone lactonase YvrE